MMSYTRMPFGKHRGKLLPDVPISYLRWLVRTVDMEEDLATAVRVELRRRHQPTRDVEPVQARGDMADVIQTWWRKLCLDYHPDRGGDTKVMQALNDAHERLKRLLGAA